MIGSDIPAGWVAEVILLAAALVGAGFAGESALI